MSKPKIKPKAKAAAGRKQPPTKKMSDSERVLAIVKNRAAIQTEPVTIKKPETKSKPRIKKAAEPSVKPRVFYDCHRRTFILLTEDKGYNRYLTCRDEELQVVKLEDGVPARDDKGQLKTQETTCICELSVCPDKEGKPYDLNKAAQRLWDSVMARSGAAVKELCLILGKPIPEIPEAVKVARKAAGERLKAARPQLAKPGDEALVTLLKKTSDVPSARAGKVLKILAGQKKGLMVTELSKMVGKPVHATVAKLVELGLVKVTK